MKQLKVLNIVVLILVLFLSGLSQEKNKSVETVDDLLVKFIEYFEDKDVEEAIKYLQKAIDLDPKKEVYMKILDYIFTDKEKIAEALKLLEQRKSKSPTKKELGVIQILTAETHFRWAEALKKKKDYINAIMHYEAAFGIAIVYRRNNSAILLNNIGGIYDDLGQEQKAMEYFEKSLSLSREVGDQMGEAISMINLGGNFSDHHQNQKALEYYEKALLILRGKGERFYEATTLTKIGQVYSDLGQYQIALEYYEKALPICREVVDRNGEALTLNNIGVDYAKLGQNQKSLEYFENALSICRENGYRAGEATSLNNIGHLYDNLGQKKIALEYMEDVLSIYRDVGDRSGEAKTLNFIGMIYFDFGQRKKSLEYFENALPIIRQMGDRSDEATTLNIIGMVYSVIGQHQKALEYFKEVLVIHREAGDHEGEAATLNMIGKVYLDLGQKNKSLEYLEKALPIYQEVGDRSDEAITLNSIGTVYSDLGQKHKALDYYENALVIRREMGDRSDEAITLNCIGKVYSSLGQNQKALDYFEKALGIRREVGNRNGEAITLNNIGKVYSDLEQNQKALSYFENVLPIFREVEDWPGVVITLNNIGNVYFDIGHKNNALATFYGKQAVNALQFLRQNIDSLDINTKLTYLKSEQDIYRITANQLFFSKRLEEAQQVLNFLKDEEYFFFVRQDWSAYTPQYSPIDYTGFEHNWIDRQNTLLEKMSSISRPFYELIIKPNKTPEEEKKLEAFKIDLDKAQAEYSAFLDRMKKDFETHEKQKDPDIDAQAKQSSVLKEFLKSLDLDNNGKTAALHYLVSKGRISVIITTPSFQTVKQSPPFDEKEFNKMIFDYRDLIEKLALLSKATDPTSISASKIDEFNNQKRDIETKLYNVIFKPVDEELKKYGAVNLLVSLDGVLRYIPLGSLWDGQHYLVQEYRFVLLTPSSLKHIDENPVIENKILGMGAGKGGNGFKPLLHIGQEIRAIVNDPEKSCTGLINGNAFIDNDFTRETMFNKLKTSTYPLVHIAGHFQFSPGDETKNQLLLGDGTTISLSDIRNQGKLFDKVNLLVLSACQTGMGGTGEEIDGFGEMAQQLGAGSVIASLWAVDDESTKELMVRFYSLLKEGKVSSKIEALRLAQLQLAGLDDLINQSKATAAPAKSSGEKSAYSNPYYWAPFIMMGNGR